jgi:hypothetical protein
MFSGKKKTLFFYWPVLLVWSIFVFVPINIFAQSSLPQNSSNEIHSWFYQYDQIRHAAQMSPTERQQADQILSKGLALFMPGQDKIVAQKLLSDLVKRYEIACQQMASLQMISATERLQRGYYQYFIEAHHLFSDYLKLQDDLLASDPATGQPLASGLIDRKQGLEQLDQSNKALDQQLRIQYSIPAYQY